MDKKEYGGIILNPSCSNYCVFCRKVPKADSSDLRQQEIRVAKDLMLFKKKGIKKIEISGSDPIEYPKINSLIRYIKELGFGHVQLSTHGRKLADYNFLDDFISSGVDRLRIPVYGPTKEIHDSVTRAKGSFNDTIKGIKKILGKAPEIQIQISCLIVQQNKKYLIQTVDFIKRLGIDDFYFSIPCLANKNRSYYIPIKNLPPYVRKAYQYSLKNNLFIHFMEIPFCVFGEISNFINNTPLPPDHGKYSQPKKEFKTNIKDMPSYRLKKKVDICKKCKAEKICHGFFVNDIDQYGLGKLKPII